MRRGPWPLVGLGVWIESWRGLALRVITAFIIVAALTLPLPVGADEHETGSIAGEVTESHVGDGNGGPLQGICVEAYEAPMSLRLEGWARTDGNGAYEIEGLDPGAYHVKLRDCRHPSTHLTEWYEDAEERESAQAVTVTQGATTGVDAVLDLGGSISGTVTEEGGDGDPIPGVKVWAWNLDRGGGPTEAETGTHGRYEIVGLREGGFRVFFFDPFPATYVAEYYDDQLDPDHADEVGVSVGELTEGIDAGLALMERPDLAVTDLVVENVPTENDNTGEGPYTGWVREITVTVQNGGNAAAADAEDSPFWDLSVAACAPTTGACDEIAGRVFATPLEPGDGIERTYRWNALETGHLGDVTIRAEAFDWRDLNNYNDTAQVHHYVVLGGTGFGVGL